MDNGISIFEIELDNPIATYAPEEIITGKVIIELKRTKKVRTIKVRFRGGCEVHWTEKKESGKNSEIIRYTGNETYFQIDVCVFGTENGDTIEMTPGQHIFPLSYNLPRLIPNSFEHNLGSVRYSIKAIIDRPWKFDHTISKSFKIEKPFEWDISNHQIAIGVDDDVEKNFCCLIPCIDRGSMSLRFQIPTTIFACGDIIDTTININNKSNSVNVTETQLKLVQELDFYALPSNKKKNVHSIVQMTKLSGPFPKKNEIKIGLPVPTLPSSYLKDCNLIDIKYRLLIGVYVSGCHCPTIKNYDIVIGTKSTVQQHPHTISSSIIKYLAPSAPPTVSESLTTPYHVPSSMAVRYNFPVRNTEVFPFNNPPYPLATFSNTSGIPYPPENIHKEPPEIGFIYSQPTAPYNHSNESRPPSYDSVIDKNHEIEKDQ